MQEKRTHEGQQGRSSKDLVLPLQVTYEDKSETMKVTTCSPSGYKQPYSPYGPHKESHGEHQYCREEYQTQAYRVPKVDEPIEVKVNGNVPEPRKECVTLALEITEVRHSKDSFLFARNLL